MRYRFRTDVGFALQLASMIPLELSLSISYGHRVIIKPLIMTRLDRATKQSPTRVIGVLKDPNFLQAI
jgi:hypothetical protein